MKEEQIRFCGLKEREVINICDCKRLGFVADLQNQYLNSGCVEALISNRDREESVDFLGMMRSILFRLSVFA